MTYGEYPPGSPYPRGRGDGPRHGGGDPYGPPPGYGQPADPYSPPGYGQPATRPSHGRPADPYDRPGRPADPYAQPADPYTPPGRPADPYGPPGYGQPADPYAPPPGYGAPTSGPPSTERRPTSGPPGYPPPPSRRSSGGSRTWLVVLSGVVAFALLAGCVVGTWFLLKDDKAGDKAGNPTPSVSASNSPTRIPADITARGTDPQPLSAAEVFPESTITISSDRPGYKVVKSEVVSDCKKVVTGNLKTAIGAADCNQAVRAAVLSPNDAYVVTVGILNLKDSAAASAFSTEAKKVSDAQKGAFSGYDAGGKTSVITRATTQMYWVDKGHYLLYLVIADAKGTDVKNNDTLRQIANDMINTHLAGKIAKREE